MENNQFQSTINRSTLTNIIDTLIFFLWSIIQAFYQNLTPFNWQKQIEIDRKVVLITGAGGGIGSELAKAFAKRNAHLILWDNNENCLNNITITCKNLGAEVLSHVIDITDRNKVYELANQIFEKFDAVEILINNAAILNPKNFSELSDEQVDKLIDVNVKALFWTTKAFLPKMLERNYGHLVCTGSVSGLVGCPGLVDYSCSKFALNGFMEALHHELLHKGYTKIKFTTVCPIFVQTKLIDNFQIFDSKLPILKPETVARKIIEAIQVEQQIVMIPRKIYLLNAVKGILPTNLYQYFVLRKKYNYK